MEKYCEIGRSLELFGSSNPGWEDAYAALHANGVKVLGEYLRRRSVPIEDAEDIVQIVFTRILKNWNRLEFQSVASWYAYLYEATRNACRDRKIISNEEIRSDVPDLQPNAEELIGKILDSERLFQMADQVWLGKPPSDAVPKCLAARCLFVEGVPADDILSILGSSSAIDWPANSEELEHWVSDVWVIRKVAFGFLYMPNDALVAILLGQPHLHSSEIDLIGRFALKRDAREMAIGGWTWGEVQYLLLRFRYGIPKTQALAKLAQRVSPEDATKINAKCRRLFPFEQVMVNVWGRLEGNSHRELALQKNPIWKRLVFQYFVGHELPQDDILDRVSPPAAIAGYPLNSINAWVAGRLADDLTKTCLSVLK